MENLINQENLEDIREFIESKISDVPGELILLEQLEVYFYLLILIKQVMFRQVL